MPAYECPICLEIYDGVDHAPTTFPCGHSCCLKHTLEMLLCHVCRAKLPDKLVPNITLIDMAVEFAEMRRMMRGLMSPPAVSEPISSSPPPQASGSPAALAAVETVETCPVAIEPLVLESLDAPAVLPAELSLPDAAVAGLPQKQQAKKAKKRKKAAAGAAVRTVATPALGFFALPLGFQLMFLQQWIGVDTDKFVITFSSLDIACCNRSLRLPLRELAESLLFSFSTNHVLAPFIKICVKDVFTYLRWLHTRKLPVNALRVTDIAHWDHSQLGSFVLPHVEAISMEVCSSKNVEQLFQVCPNVKALYWQDTSTGIVCHNTVPEIFVSKCQHLKLNVLQMSCTFGISDRTICDVLKTFGGSLQNLTIGQQTGGFSRETKGISKVVAVSIAQNCKKLTTLSVAVNGIPLQRLFQILDGCPHIFDLMLFGLESLPDLYFLLEEYRRLRIVTLSGTKWKPLHCVEGLAVVLERDLLIRFKISPEFGFDRQGSLNVFAVVGTNFPLPVLHKLFSAARAVQVLQLTMISADAQLMELIAGYVGPSVQHLLIACNPSVANLGKYVLLLALACPLLKVLECNIQLSAAALADISATCPRFEKFHKMEMME